MSECTSEAHPPRWPDPRFPRGTCYIERITIPPAPVHSNKPQGATLLNVDLLSIPQSPDVEHDRLRRPGRVLALPESFLDKEVIEFSGLPGALAFAAAELELLFEQDLANGTLPEIIQKSFE